MQFIFYNLQSCPGPRNCLKCSLNWSQTKINFKRVHHSKTSISSSCAKFKGRYIKLLFPKSLLEIQNLTKVSFPFTSSVYFKSVDLNVHHATCPKNVLMLNIKWWLKVVHVDIPPWLYSHLQFKALLYDAQHFSALLKIYLWHKSG